MKREEEKQADLKPCVIVPGLGPVAKLGQGGWYLGDEKACEESEIKALRTGIELGMTLIDTAEMYGSGSSERLIGKAIRPYRREELTLVSKVYPHHAGKDQIFHSCEASLKRLGTDYLDVYLLHWRGSIPLAETAACMEQLKKQGKIRAWGVSNFDTEDMKELFSVPEGAKCALNQVLYHLGSRGIEYDLIPWHEHAGIPLMAYCPLAQAGTLRQGLLNNEAVRTLAAKYQVSAVQILLAFVMRWRHIIAIPKAAAPQHVKENARAASLALETADWRLLDEAFPPPRSKTYLDIV